MEPTHKAHAGTSANPTGGTLAAPRSAPALGGCGWPVVAPEVAARILAWRATGQPVSDIARDLHLTPAEVFQVFRAADRATAADRAATVRETGVPG